MDFIPLAIDSADHSNGSMYSHLVQLMREAYAECKALGIAEDVFSKGGIGEFILAHHLNHELVDGGGGADGIDPATGNRYEYKVSTQTSFHFGFGPRKTDRQNEKLLRRKFSELSGAFLAQHHLGLIQRVVFCEPELLLEDLIESLKASKAGLLTKRYSFDQAIRFGREIEPPTRNSHPYDASIPKVRLMFQLAHEQGLRATIFSKGGQGEVLLAQHLGHAVTLHPGGADAEDSTGGLHEYKISATNQFNFNHGARRSPRALEKLLHEKFQKIDRVWVAARQEMDIIDCESCTGPEMGNYLISHFNGTKGKQLTKNFSMQEFRRLFK
ncbi:MAG: hypothetical protein MK089_09320 [Phycisphaerales bacterium]|nr:hypothetical protein [Phycisphaerales bacterium]